jgi:predicted Zn-dependent peptidase
MFTIRAIAAAGVELARVESLIEEQIALIISRPADTAELDKAKVQLYSGTVRGLSTYNEIAQTIVRSAVVRGSARLLDNDVARYNAVGAETIRAVAAATFVPMERSTIEYLAVSA